MTAGQNRPVRLRTAATDKRRALEHYQDLRRAGKVARAVVIAEALDGSVTVLGQMLTPDDIAGLLLVAADAVAYAANQKNRPALEPHQEPERRGVHNQSKPRAREMTTDADGLLVPPKGENIISCGATTRAGMCCITTTPTPRAATCARTAATR